MSLPATSDIAIVGGGIVGLATARATQQRFPGRRVVVLEKEPRVAQHQTGRNSGVIHSGIYYKPGSLKARLCREGAAALELFCEHHGIPFARCGKVIVATTAAELAELDRLERRGIENGLRVRRLDQAGLRDLEPHAAGLAALHVPATGIVDYRRVAATLAALVEADGGEIRCGTRVLGASGGIVQTSAGDFQTRMLINCAGLQSDRVARAAGAPVASKIVPFRGEYYRLRPGKAALVRGLIYPVPNPRFPFLGVHCTRMIDGSVHLGPNAVLAFAREGYGRTTVAIEDLGETLTYPGFWRLAARHWRDGIEEIGRSLSRRAFVRSLQRLVPEITEADVVPCTAGVRAQALLRDGTLVDDFLIVRQPRAVHVLNAPSPAATASLAIGTAIASMIDPATLN